MSILVVGLSHHTASLAVLERAAISGDDLGKLLLDVHASPHVAEAVIVSTCNRVEVYAEVDRFHGGVTSVSELLARYSGVPLEELTRHLYVHYEHRAVQHVLSVASGLDSMVIGEEQILGQVRAALKLAQRRRTVGRSLNELLQYALRVGKRVRATTAIGRAGATLVSVGLRQATRTVGPLRGLRTLVVGAGSMSGLAVRTLAAEGVSEIVVANRTHARAAQMADSVRAAGPARGATPAAAEPAAEPETAGPAAAEPGAVEPEPRVRAIELTGLPAALATADLVVSCTGAAGQVISVDQVRDAMARRSGESTLFLLDLALPHDIDPAVRALPGVALLDLEGLRGAGEGGHTDDIEAVRRIVAEEVVAFTSAARASHVSPTVVALRSKAAEVVDAELARLSGRLPGIDEAARGEIAQTVRRVVDKLLHEPTVRVKELAGVPGGDAYAAALRELFDLDARGPEAVARADLAADDLATDLAATDVADTTHGEGDIR
jgi:glutamyl-tRNA reductase